MEIINSFTDTIKERTKNPFFGTLIFVWLFRNWEVVFAIFNFKEGFGHEEKIAFIEKHYENKLLWGIFTNNILIALSLMILGYLLIVITRVIVNIVERNLMPYLNEKTDNTLVVSKERFIDVKRTRDEYAQSNDDLQELLIQSQQKLSQQKLESERLSKDYESVSTENSKLHQEAAKNEIKLIETKAELKTLNSKVNGLTNDLNEVRAWAETDLRNKYDFSDLMSDYLKNVDIDHSPNSLGVVDRKVLDSFLTLLSDKRLETFIDVYGRISKNPNRVRILDNDLDYFISRGLFTANIENRIRSTPAGDFVYVLAKSGIGSRKRGMGL